MVGEGRNLGQTLNLRRQHSALTQILSFQNGIFSTRLDKTFGYFIYFIFIKQPNTVCCLDCDDD